METTNLQPGQGDNVVQPGQGDSKQTQGQGGNSQPSVKVGGREYKDMSELASDYQKLMAEHTKLTMNKSQPTDQEQLSKDDLEILLDAMTPALASRGFITKKEVEEESLATRFFTQYPSLKDKEKQIKELASIPTNKGKAYEDIASEYGFLSSNTIQKAKLSGDIKGSKGGDEVTPFSQLDPLSPEYEKWRKAHGLR